VIDRVELAKKGALLICDALERYSRRRPRLVDELALDRAHLESEAKAEI
jgi:hypothetical protein